MTRYAIHKSKLLPRLRALKEFKDEYESLITLKLKNFAETKTTEVKNTLLIHKKIEATGGTTSKSDRISKDETPNKTAIRGETPEELKDFMVHSEFDKIFAQKKITLNYFKEKKNWRMPDRTKAEYTDLYPEGHFRTIREEQTRQTLLTAPQDTSEEKVDTERYLKNLKLNHEKKIGLEKIRRMLLKRRPLEGRNRASETNLSGTKWSFSRTHYRTEKHFRADDALTITSFGATFRGSKVNTDLEHTKERDGLKKMINLSRKPHTDISASSVDIAMQSNSLNFKKRRANSQNLVSSDYVKDRFRVPFRSNSRDLSESKIRYASPKIKNRPISGLTFNNLTLHPNQPEETGKGIMLRKHMLVSSIIGKRSHSKMSIDNSRRIQSAVKLSVDDAKTQVNLNHISQGIYSMCQLKNTEDVKNRLLKGFLVQSSRMPIS